MSDTEKGNDMRKLYRKKRPIIGILLQQKQFSKILFVSSLVLFVITLFVVYKTYPYNNELNMDGSMRGLLDTEKECYPKKVKYGFLPFFILGVFYMFIALSIVVDEFFVPSLEIISDKWKLSSDVAGATLMAAGGSAPELFTSFFGTFKDSAVGFAAIVFNVLFVIACCAFASYKPLKLTWFPLFRDCSWYILSLGLLSLFFSYLSHSKIIWYEALILLSTYLLYVLFMKNNEKIYNKYFKSFTKINVHRQSVQDTYRLELQPQFKAGILEILFNGMWHNEFNITQENVAEKFDYLDTDDSGKISIQEFLNAYDFKEYQINIILQFDKDGDKEIDFDEFQQMCLEINNRQKDMISDNDISDIPDGVQAYLRIPNGFRPKFWYFLTIILILLFYYTIPDVRKRNNEKYRYIAFIVSIIWVGFASYLMVTWTEVIGDTLKIPIVVMGLTFLAAGTSVPDLLSSMVVARNGYGDMAVSSSIGSNIFDILVGLPLPWLSYTIINQKSVYVDAQGLELSVLILLGMVAAVILLIKLAKWKMTKQLGFAMLLLYIGFVTQDLLRSNWSC